MCSSFVYEYVLNKARHKRLDKEVVIKKVHADIMIIVDCSAEANI